MSKFSVYQHWDKLEVCVVGRSYPPEYYSWIENAQVRNLFDRIATETEEDYQGVIKKLTEFGVEVLRPDLPALDSIKIQDKYSPPPMTPRDHMVMVGEKFYKGYQLDVTKFYSNIKGDNWPAIKTEDDFWNLPSRYLLECRELHDLDSYIKFYH
jgi:hypothetical protein